MAAAQTGRPGAGQLFRPACELTQAHPDILCEYNVKIPIADGVVLTANVFRSLDYR